MWKYGDLRRDSKEIVEFQLTSGSPRRRSEDKEEGGRNHAGRKRPSRPSRDYTGLRVGPQWD